MKKLIYITVTIFFFSCGVQKNLNIDPYIGNFNMTIFDVDQLGDIELNLAISKKDNGHESTFTDPDGNDPYIDINSSIVNEGFYEIDANYQGYDVFFKILIEGDELSGSVMGMYDIKGKRIK